MRFYNKSFYELIAYLNINAFFLIDWRIRNSQNKKHECQTVLVNKKR